MQLQMLAINERSTCADICSVPDEFLESPISEANVTSRPVSLQKFQAALATSTIQSHMASFKAQAGGVADTIGCDFSVTVKYREKLHVCGPMCKTMPPLVMKAHDLVKERLQARLHTKKQPKDWTSVDLMLVAEVYQDGDDDTNVVRSFAVSSGAIGAKTGDEPVYLWTLCEVVTPHEVMPTTYEGIVLQHSREPRIEFDVSATEVSSAALFQDSLETGPLRHKDIPSLLAHSS